jgi:Domain of unknown function (DUF4397)
MRLRRFAFVCAIGACILAACGNNNLLGTTTATQSAIRFINGSPDLGPVDIYLNGTGSTATTTGLAYKSATTLYYQNSQSYTVTVTPTGSKTASIACGTPSLAANTRYTVVIAGKATPNSTPNDGLQCQIFAETIYSLPVGQFQLAFHNASPALAAAAPVGGGTGFGLFTNSMPPVYNVEAGPIATFTAPTSGVANGVAVNALVPGVETAPGIGVYASVASSNGAPNPPTTVQATLLPSQLQNGYISAITTTPACPDAGNFYPIQTPSPTPTPASTTPPTPSPTPSPLCTAVSNVMSVYAIDAPTGSSTVANLVGVSD